MNHIFRFLVLFSVLAVVFPNASSADESATAVSLEEIQTQRLQAENAQDLRDSLRTRINGLYDTAAASLETAVMFDTERLAKERERASLSRLGRQLRSALGEPEPVAVVDLPENASVDQAEDRLARARSRLAADRSTLRNVERIAEEQATARSEISLRLGALDQQIDILNDELMAPATGDAATMLRTATRSAAAARRQAAINEIAMLRTSLELLEARTVLVPLQIDLAQRRVTHSEQVVALLETRTAGLRHEAAATALREIREHCQRATETSPQLADAAAETEVLAEMLWGENGIVNRTESRTRTLLETRKDVANLDRIGEMMRRKFEAFGNRGSISRWWPQLPPDFPEPGDVASTLRQLDTEIPEVQHRLIEFEEYRSSNRTIGRQVLDQLTTGDGLDDAELAAEARELFTTRRELLDSLVQLFGRYSTQLAEHRVMSQQFLIRLETLERFLYSQLLWARSVPKPTIPRWQDLAASAQWLTLADHRRQTAAAGSFAVESMREGNVAQIVLLVLAIVFRRRFKRRLENLSDRLSDPDTRDRFRWTVEAVLYTALLTAPVPLACFLASGFLLSAGSSTFFASSAFAFSILGQSLGLVEFVRQLLAPHGLAEAHFGWPSQLTRPAYRRLIWSWFTATPFLYIAMQLVGAGVRLDSPAELQVYNNSLGRLSFIIAMSILGLTLLTLLKVERKKPLVEANIGSTLTNPFKHYDIPVAHVICFPLVILATLIPTLLAASGFYITALLLSYQLLRTIWLVISVLLLGGLLSRWRTTRREREQRERGDKPESDWERTEREASDVQVRQLFRFALIVASCVGLYSIWADALPTLQVMKRVQIWPRIVVLDYQDTRIAALTAIQGQDPSTVVSGESAASAQRSDSPATGSPIPLPSTPEPSDVSATQPTVLTLWVLFEAILAAIGTVVLARNLPGLLDLGLKRRTNLDKGARVAFTTLGRYSITIVGVSVVFGLLGIGWSKIQWLAAALTFGLGFGLQEIVANFVSGIILLVERPVRVDDVVTIGNLMGRVTRIQIRATTITLWDRSEMIVPNKEFITTKLVNWTLADSRRRIEVPLRIAYGADLDLVKRTLVEVAEQHPDALDDPAPQALLLNFGTDAIQFELRFVVEFGKGVKTKDEVQMNIDRAFKERGIEFALPQLKLTLPDEDRPRGGDEKQKKYPQKGDEGATGDQ